MSDEEKRTKQQALVDYVMDRYSYARSNSDERRGAWREYYRDYRATRVTNKEPWQANYIIPALKDAVRVKLPLYLNILFAGGLQSWDIEPGDLEDEPAIPILKDIILWQLGCVGTRRGGFWREMENFIRQFEIFGYSACKIPWAKQFHRGKLVYQGPDVETISVFDLFPDPGVPDLEESWVIHRKRDVFVSYLRQMEKAGLYHSVRLLKDTTQPAGDSDPHGGRQDDRVELLEYHGDVPRDLLEGKITDEYLANPYEDDYVQAIITIGNERVCLRNDAYPFRAGGIFLDAAKDNLPNERFGVGTAEDIQAMAEELTNAHNKLTDSINIIANPNIVINPHKVIGGTSGVLLNYPGKVWLVNPAVDSVTNAFQYVNTSAQAAALNPILALINALEEKIMKISQAVPVISPAVDKKGLPDTLGATLMMQSNASEPLKSVVKHYLEPWFVRVLEIFCKHNEQFFTEADAYRVLGEERAERWVREKARRKIGRKDFALQGSPHFIPRGVTVFSEKQAEIQALIEFLQVSQGAMEPAYGPDGTPAFSPDGQPAMQPLVDQREIIKRIAQKAGFDDIERLIPSLARERDARETMVMMQRQMPSLPPPGRERGGPPLGL